MIILLGVNSFSAAGESEDEEEEEEEEEDGVEGTSFCTNNGETLSESENAYRAKSIGID
jgi:hypothetical protein